MTTFECETSDDVYMATAPCPRAFECYDEGIILDTPELSSSDEEIYVPPVDEDTAEKERLRHDITLAWELFSVGLRVLPSCVTYPTKSFGMDSVAYIPITSEEELSTGTVQLYRLARDNWLAAKEFLVQHGELPQQQVGTIVPSTM